LKFNLLFGKISENFLFVKGKIKEEINKKLKKASGKLAIKEKLKN